MSNFHVHRLEDLLANSEIVPMVDQVEHHPLLTQKNLHTFCKQYRIWLGSMEPFDAGEPGSTVLQRFSEKYGKSPAQIVLR